MAKKKQGPSAEKKWEPVAAAYRAFAAGEVDRARRLYAAVTLEAVEQAEADQAAAWKEVQLAFIEATSDINAHHKWPLIHEDFVVRILTGAGLYSGPSAGKLAWDAVYGPKGPGGR